jgi:hypothetical protein
MYTNSAHAQRNERTCVYVVEATKTQVSIITAWAASGFVAGCLWQARDESEDTSRARHGGLSGCGRLGRRFLLFHDVDLLGLFLELRGGGDDWHLLVMT